jgi:hypothetical protein
VGHVHPLLIVKLLQIKGKEIFKKIEMLQQKKEKKCKWKFSENGHLTILNA